MEVPPLSSPLSWPVIEHCPCIYTSSNSNKGRIKPIPHSHTFWSNDIGIKFLFIETSEK